MSLRYHLDDSVKRRCYIIFVLQSWSAPELFPAGVASLLRSLHRQRECRKRRSRDQHCVFVDFEWLVLEGYLVTFWRSLYVTGRRSNFYLYPKKVDEVVSAIVSRFKILESWGEASGEYVAFMSLAFGGVGSVGRTGENAVGSAWATPVDLKTLTIPPPIDNKLSLFVYSLFDPSDGRVMVWILEVPRSVFDEKKERNRITYVINSERMAAWLWEVHEKAYRQFMGVERIVWYDPEIKLGVKLFERLRGDGERCGGSGAVLDVFLEMFK
jgi:hypothetical protein